MQTKIEWATDTLNWLAGCRKKSPACKNCYAERMTARLATMPHAPSRYHRDVVTDRRFNGTIAYDPEAMVEAFRAIWRSKRPMRVFVNSMSDTFDPAVPPESLIDLAEMIKLDAQCLSKRRDDHVLMLLTKCPDRMAAWQAEHFPEGLPAWVWCGTTVEDQERADERIPHLLRVVVQVGGVRFLSCEPLLGPLDLSRHLIPDNVQIDDGGPTCEVAEDRGTPSGWAEIRWVIAGGESGPGARPSHPDWFRGLRDQCEAAGKWFFFKQWGEFCPEDRPEVLAQAAADNAGPASGMVRRAGKAAAGRLLDGRTHDEVPHG